MLSYLKALPIILTVALVTFWLAGLAFPAARARGEIHHARLVFLLVTIAAFASPNIWSYAVMLAVIVFVSQMKHELQAGHGAVLWAGLAVAVPNVGVYLPGAVGIGTFLEVTHLRVLTLALVPSLIAGITFGQRCPRPLGLATDWFVLGFFLLQLGLIVPNVSMTVLLREGVVLAVDTLMPYWLFSRAVASISEFTQVVRAFVVTMLVMCAVAAFEAVLHWPLYDSVSAAWGVQWDMSVFIIRGGLLRAKAAAGFSLMLGFALVLALGLWLSVRREVVRPGMVVLGDISLAVGLVAALARGAWVGAIVLLLLVTLTGARPMRRLATLVMMGAFLVGVAAVVPQLRVFLDLLPFIGKTESDNVEYRQRLIEVALALIAQSPLFGVPGYLAHMEEMRQGQGIIDIVNSYIAVALNSGVVGLSLFVGVFLSVLWSLLQLRWREGPLAEGGRVAGCLIATVLAAMLVLATTSSIVIVTQLSYMLVGLGVSWARLHRTEPARAYLMGAAR